MKNWRPVSLLNVDYKTVLKALAARLKNILPKVISSDQYAGVTNRFIGENGKLISDISKVAIFESYIGWSWKLDCCHGFWKSFWFFDHTQVIQVLRRYGFGKSFIRWVEITASKQESYVITGGNTTKYFILEKKYTSRRSYFSILRSALKLSSLEVLFILIKNKSFIERLKNILIISSYIPPVPTILLFCYKCRVRWRNNWSFQSFLNIFGSKTKSN